MPVHRGEPNIGHLVQPLQLCHHELTDVRRRDFLVWAFLQTVLHALDDALQLGHRDRTLFAGLEKPIQDLLPIEPLSSSVLFHHHIRDLIDAFIAGKAPLATEALATPADHRAFLAFPRVDDFVS